MIRLERVSKARGDRLVLASVDLNLERGQMLCLTGPSGSGKSTLLDLAAGMIRPDQGRRQVATHRLGYALQDDGLLPWLSVYDNVMFALSGSGLPHPGQRALQWLERFGLTAFSSRRPGQLSGGQRRRLNLARSLAVDPDLLLWDEPFAFLDPDWQREVVVILEEIHGKTAPAVLVVTHDDPGVRLADWPVYRITHTPVALTWGC